jgi:hypothetical protein
MAGSGRSYDGPTTQFEKWALPTILFLVIAFLVGFYLFPFVTAIMVLVVLGISALVVDTIKEREKEN